MGRRWRPEEDDMVRQLWDEGLTVDQIAGRLGRTYYSTRDRVNNVLGLRRNESRAVTDGQLALMERMWRDGRSMKAISHELGIPMWTISHITGRDRARFPRRYAESTTGWIPQAIELRRAGHSFYAIAEEVGVNYWTVERRLHDAGVA